MYQFINNKILQEISNSLNKVDIKETMKLMSEINKAEKIFLCAVGRVNLSLQSFGKRLSHLGYNIELVGSLTEKPATKKDLLIIASGSGESIIPLTIAKKAKLLNVKIGLITSANKSSIKKICSFHVTIIAPTKEVVKTRKMKENLFDQSSKTKLSIQPMSTLFDQALHIYGDIVSLMIMKKQNKKSLWKYHSNLE